MSEDNVQVWRRMYDAFSRGDFEAALAHVDSEVVVDASHRVDGRVGHGHDELNSILAEWLGSWEDWGEDIEEVRDVGDRVLVVSTQHGRGKGSGIEWENRFAMLYEVQKGKIIRWTIYDDPHAAFEAVGLQE